MTNVDITKFKEFMKVNFSMIGETAYTDNYTRIITSQYEWSVKCKLTRYNKKLYMLYLRRMVQSNKNLNDDYVRIYARIAKVQDRSELCFTCGNVDYKIVLRGEKMVMLYTLVNDIYWHTININL